MESAIFRAARDGNLELIMRQEPASVLAKDYHGWTPLHWAAAEGHVHVVRLLLAELRAEMDAENDNGETPLHLAAKSGHADVVKVLVTEFQANPHIVTPSLVHQAELYRYWMDVGDETDTCHSWTPLHFAACYGHPATVRLLVTEFQAKVQADDGSGWTPLHLAASQGHVEVARMLLTELGADGQAEDYKKWTPLHHAALYGQIEMVKLLWREFRLNVLATDKYRLTPLHFAASQRHTAVMKLLLVEMELSDGDYKDIVNVAGEHGRTLLHYAAEVGCVDSVKLLVESLHARAEFKDNGYSTPLHKAILNGHVEVAIFLNKGPLQSVDFQGMYVFSAHCFKLTPNRQSFYFTSHSKVPG